MSPEEFASAIYDVVTRDTTEGLLAAVREPPGRRPPDWLMNLSEWIASLSKADREMAGRFAHEVAAAATRSLLGILDGSIAIEGPGPKGQLVLTYDRDGTSIRLNEPDAALLEDVAATLIENARDSGWSAAERQS